MDEDTIDNIRYKIELKKLIGDSVPLSNDANNEEIHSDPWETDLDLLSTVPNTEPQEDEVDNDISYSVLYSKDDDETKLIDKSNMDLYSDLVEIEEQEKKTRQIHETELENCKKELQELKKRDAINKKKIDDLITENVSIKKNISSLYRTVKREIEFKDKSLADASAEIVKLRNSAYRKNGQIFKNERCSNCENNGTSFKIDSVAFKRRRSVSPESSSKRRHYRSNRSKTFEADSQSEKDGRKADDRPEHGRTKINHSSDSPNYKDKMDTSQKHVPKDMKHNKETQTSKDTKDNKTTQTSNQCVYCELPQSSSSDANGSRDPREINEVFFSLLPESLKKTFYEYEQNQFTSLNKLKEAFLDEYFDSVNNAPSPILESTPKTQDMHAGQSVSNVGSQNRSSSNLISTPTSSIKHHDRTEFSRRLRKKDKGENITNTEKDCAQNSTLKESKNCKISRTNKKDLIFLFKYKKERIPFTDKMKFGLHKEDKKLIPENLL